MIRRTLLIGSILLPLAGLAWLHRPLSVLAVETMSEAEFAAILKAVPPRHGEEQYAEIDWQLDLIAAKHKAALERKPLLIWSMDGHPLGCG